MSSRASAFAAKSPPKPPPRITTRLRAPSMRRHHPPTERKPVADPLAGIPGSDSLLELPRMLKDARAFLDERYGRHGPIFRSRFLFPIVFGVSPEANKT